MTDLMKARDDARRAAQVLLGGLDRGDVVASLQLASLIPLNKVSSKTPSVLVEYAQALLLGFMPTVDTPKKPVSIDEVENALARAITYDQQWHTNRNELLSELDPASQQFYISNLYSHDPGPAFAELHRVLDIYADFEAELISVGAPTAEQAARAALLVDDVWQEGVSEFFKIARKVDLPLMPKLLKMLKKGRISGNVISGFGEAVSFSSEDLERAVGADAARYILANLTSGQSRDNHTLKILSEMRLKPIMQIGDGRYLAPVYPNLVHALAPMLDGAIKSLGGDTAERLQKSKSSYTERHAIEVFSHALKPDLVLRNLRYPDPDRTATNVVSPEGDGLIVLGHVALVVEAKAGGFSPSAQAGDIKAIRGVVQKLITDAQAQAHRTIRAMRKGPITGVDENDVKVEFDASHVKTFFPVVVTLEDLSSVSPRVHSPIAAEELEGSRFVANPWITNVDDLSWIASTIRPTARLLNYIDMRCLISGIPQVTAASEADWMVKYLDSGPQGVIDVIDAAQEVGPNIAFIATRERRGAQVSPGSVPLPRLVEALDSRRPPGWLMASLIVISHCGDSELADSRKLRSDLDSVRNTGRAVMRAVGSDSWAVAICTTPTPGVDLRAATANYPAEKIVAFERTLDNPAAYTNFLYLDRSQ
ncbi:hypothetical protein [Streptomyces justiciae]|uniref:hypothetical protein n=1 Tax=Streptomyces justiciae TaxID=2780140 RepID=UPI00187E2876|nr:hypothetical protein [Streptomyces justiciae]MBE8471599.1 hypothetical protein [Streptomyces justiciae]